MKHIVNLIVSNPSHEFVSMRSRTHEKSYLQEGRTPEEAINRATRHFRTLGFKVHSATIQEQKAPEAAPQQSLTEGIVDEIESGKKVKAAQDKQAAAKQKAQAEVDKSDVQQRADKAQAGSALQRYLANKAKKMEEAKEVEQLEEELKVSDGAAAWIHDFVHSKDPKFDGKTKEERIQQALGAFYAAQRALKEEVEQVDEASMKGMPFTAAEKARLDKKVTPKDLEVSLNDIPGRLGKAPRGSKTLADMSDIKLVNKLTKEEADQVDEANTSKSQLKKPSPVDKANELMRKMDQGEHVPAKKLMKAIEKAKAHNFNLGKGYNLDEDAEQLDEVSRKHFQQVADLIAANDDAAKRKELAQHHAEIFAKQNPRFSKEKFFAAANAKLDEEVEQLDETGETKKFNKSIKNLRLRVKGARAMAGSGLDAEKLDLKNKKGEYLKPRDVNLAAGRALSKGQLEEGFDDPKQIAKELVKRHGKDVTMQNIIDLEGERDSSNPLDREEVMVHVKNMREESEGATPKTAKEKELAAKAGDPNKITKKDVLVARGVDLKEEPVEEGYYKELDTEKKETKRLAKKEVKDSKQAKAAETAINLAKSKKNKINVNPTLDHNK